MKLKDVTGPIGLMLRIDGHAGRLAFENMQSRNIQGTRDWSLFSVKLPYPKGAKTIFIGAILSGSGQLWVDDFQVLLDGKNISEAKLKQYKTLDDKEFDAGSKISAIALTSSNLEHLDVLGKVWGFLKYYHPRITNGYHNWDYELFRITPKILEAKSQRERNSILNSWILSLGEFELDKGSDHPKEEIKIMPDLSWINKATLGKELTATLGKVRVSKRTEENYYVEKIFNPMSELKNEKAYSTMTYPDAGFRLLSLYRYWNVINYYFPYRNLIEEDWNKVLAEYIPHFIKARDELEYKLAALSMIARIHDTHANIWGDNTINNYKGDKYAPLEITFVEDKAIVTSYFDNSLGKKSGLQIGDVIEFIDGKSVEEIIKEKIPLMPASNYPTQLRDIARDLLRTNKSTLDIKYWNGKERSSTQIETSYPYFFSNYEMRQKVDTCFKLIDPQIAYLYPGIIKNEYLAKIMAEVQNTKGLIIDLRCYPSEFIVFTLSKYLLPEKKSFAKFSRSSLSTPGLFTMEEVKTVGESNPDYYKGKVVIIVNEKTQSQAEYTTMAFRTAPQATVIGSTTAAADGDVLRFFLPGGLNTMISGLGVYYPDGTETQRIGIVPDIEVKPTIKGIREGKDELLEKAIKIINGE